jgi:hypothetical protein
VAYAGRSQFTGLDQINFIVPTASSVQGCFVQVAVEVAPQGGASVISNFSSIAVDPNGATCRDANGLNMNDFATAYNSGGAKVGIISLNSLLFNQDDFTFPPYDQWAYDTLNAAFVNISSSGIIRMQGIGSLPSVNNCSVTPFQFFLPAIDPAFSAFGTPLDAGAALQAQAPNGTQISVAKIGSVATPPPAPQVMGWYNGFLGGRLIGDWAESGGAIEHPSFFLVSTKNQDTSYTFGAMNSGAYTVTGPGGADVGAFTATINVSAGDAGLQWSNSSNVANSNQFAPVLENQPLSITWTGGDPAGYVNIMILGLTTPNTLIDPAWPGVVGQCVATASSGTFTVPPFVLEAIPTRAQSSSGSPLSGAILVGPVSAPVKISPAPSGLTAAYIFYNLVQGYAAYF